MMMNILFAADQSRDSKAASHFLRGVRFPAGSMLSILHVMEACRIPAAFLGSSPDAEQQVATLRHETKVRAGGLLRKIAELLRGRGLRVRSFVEEGLPVPVILETIDRDGIDLAVLGTRGLRCEAVFSR